MAGPRASTAVASNGQVQNFSVPLPTLAAGDLLVMAIFEDGGACSVPSGWTAAFQDAHNSDVSSLFYKTAVAGDSGTSVGLTNPAGTTDWAVVTSSWPGATFYMSGTGTAVTASPVTGPAATMGSKAGVAIAFSGVDPGNATTSPNTSQPSGYTAINSVIGGSSGARLLETRCDYLDVAAGGTASSWSSTFSDAGNVYVAAIGATILLNQPSAPSAPTLNSPANASYEDASPDGITFTSTYNSTDGADQNAYAARIKVSGASAYSYYNASTNALQSTIVWNAVSTAPGAEWSYTIPAAALADGNTYNWSAASQEASANLQGPFATDFTFNAQAAPNLSVQAPTGTVVTSTTELQYTPTPPSGASVTGGRWLIYPLATTQASGFAIDIGTGTIPAGAISDVTFTGNPLTVAMQSGVTLANSGSYVAYAAVTETGSEWSSTISSAFTASFDAPAQPTLTAVAGTDSTTGAPLVTLTVGGHDNLLSAVDASFESGVGTWTDAYSATVGTTTAAALDGSHSLSQANAGAGPSTTIARVGNYTVTAGQSYVFMAAFRPVSQARTPALQFYDSTGAEVASPAVTEIPGAWVYSIGTATTAASATTAYVRANIGDLGTGGQPAGQLATPAAPTVTPTGTAGTTSYFYKLVGHNAYGTVTGTEGSTTTGNATLSSTNYNALTWTAETGVTSWDVWRGTAAGGENVLVTSGVTGTSYNDIGGGTSGTIPSANTTGETHYVDEVGIFPGDTLGYQLEVLSDGPSAYFPLTDAAGATTAVNAVGSGDGTVNGGVTFGETGVIASDPTQTAVAFDGTSGYITSPDSPALDVGNTPHTVECWFNPKPYVSGDYSMLITKDVGNGSGATQYELRVDPSGQLEGGYSGNTVISPSALPVGQWSHVVLLYSGGEYSLYINGSLVSGPTAPSSSPTTNARPLYIGQRDDMDASHYANGDIAHVAVYPTALSAARIQAHYNAALNTAGHIVQKWTAGGFAGNTTATVTFTDADNPNPVTLRNGQAVPLPTPNQQATITDNEATPGVPRTYTATVSATI